MPHLQGALAPFIGKWYLNPMSGHHSYLLLLSINASMPSQQIELEIYIEYICTVASTYLYFCVYFNIYLEPLVHMGISNSN
jgi:hypothetical protein